MGGSGASGRELDDLRVAGDRAADRFDEAEDDPGLAIDRDRDVEVGPVARQLGRPRMVALEEDRLAAADDVGAGHGAAAGRQDVLAVPGRVDERVGQGLGRAAAVIGS